MLLNLLSSVGGVAVHTGHTLIHTSIKLLLRRWVRVQVFLQCSQLTPPLAASILVSAHDNKIIQSLLKAFITKNIKVFFIASGAGLVLLHHAFDAGPAEAVSTAGGLVGLTQNVQTYGTVELKLTRLVNELTLKACLKRSSPRLESGGWWNLSAFFIFHY
jgi:hypothetical protein